MAEHRVPRDAAHGDAHAATRVAVEAGLRAVRLVAHDDRARGGRREPQLLRQRRERREGLAQLRDVGVALQPDAHRGHVAVHDVHAMALGADHERGRLDPAAVQPAEDFARLALDLLFFVRDERHHVVRDVERGDARVARAGDGL